MGHTVHYQQGDFAARLQAGRRDARAYMGDARYTRVLAILRDTIASEGFRVAARHYRFLLSFAGVQGLPAEAMFREAAGLGAGWHRGGQSWE